MISLVVHIVGVMLLALVVLSRPPATRSQGLTLIRTESAAELPPEVVCVAEISADEPSGSAADSPLTSRVASAVVTRAASGTQIRSFEGALPDRTVPLDVTEKVVSTRLSQATEAMIATMELSGASGDFLKELLRKGDFAGRTPAGRRILAKAFGGTAESEEAVEAGLDWLERHQNADGSWSFNHVRHDCDETCTEPGMLVEGTVAATAMAMLCFAGAGYTHEVGPYQEEMNRGLTFLKRHLAQSAKEGDMRQVLVGPSGMYSQGLATMVLTELHGMTLDDEIGPAARSCVQFVLDAQSPSGGWRYVPRSRMGDTSVSGWEVMALTSARMSRIQVPRRHWRQVERFLDSVDLDGGAYYGYMTPQKRPSTTAIGLLCRMYMGWKRENRALKKGVAFLGELGPAREDMYYNYYATQVMHHWGGDEWRRWNAVMREELVGTQAKLGHSKGSWSPRDRHGRFGGRHYMTCLALLTLEVYYRHLPLYQDRAVHLDPGEQDDD